MNNTLRIRTDRRSRRSLETNKDCLEKNSSCKLLLVARLAVSRLNGEQSAPPPRGAATKLFDKGRVLSLNATMHSLGATQKDERLCNRSLFDQAISHRLIELSYANRFQPLLDQDVDKTCFSEKEEQRHREHQNRQGLEDGSCAGTCPEHMYKSTACNTTPNSSRSSFSFSYKRMFSSESRALCQLVLRYSTQRLKELAPRISKGGAPEIVTMWNFALSTTFFLVSVTALVQKQALSGVSRPLFERKLPGLHRPCYESSWDSFENIAIRYASRASSPNPLELDFYRDRCLARLAPPWEKQLHQHFVAAFPVGRGGLGRLARGADQGPGLGRGLEAVPLSLPESWLVSPYCQIEAVSPPPRADRPCAPASCTTAAGQGPAGGHRLAPPGRALHAPAVLSAKPAAGRKSEASEYEIERPWIVTCRRQGLAELAPDAGALPRAGLVPATVALQGQGSQLLEIELAPRAGLHPAGRKLGPSAAQLRLYARAWRDLEGETDSTPSKLACFSERGQDLELLRRGGRAESSEAGELPARAASERDGEPREGLATTLKSRVGKAGRGRKPARASKARRGRNSEGGEGAARQKHPRRDRQAQEGEEEELEGRHELLPSPHNVLKNVFYQHGALLPPPGSLVEANEDERGETGEGDTASFLAEDAVSGVSQLARALESSQFAKTEESDSSSSWPLDSSPDASRHQGGEAAHKVLQQVPAPARQELQGPPQGGTALGGVLQGQAPVRDLAAWPRGSCTAELRFAHTHGTRANGEELSTGPEPVLARLRSELVSGLRQLDAARPACNTPTIAQGAQLNPAQGVQAGRQQLQGLQAVGLHSLHGLHGEPEQPERARAKACRDVFREQDVRNFDSLSDGAPGFNAPGLAHVEGGACEPPCTQLPKPDPLSFSLPAVLPQCRAGHGSAVARCADSLGRSGSPAGQPEEALQDEVLPGRRGKALSNLVNDSASGQQGQAPVVLEASSHHGRDRTATVLDQLKVAGAFPPSSTETDYETIRLSPRFMSGYIFPELTKNARRVLLQRHSLFTPACRAGLRFLTAGTGAPGETRSGSSGRGIGTMSVKRVPSLPACASRRGEAHCRGASNSDALQTEPGLASTARALADSQPVRDHEVDSPPYVQEKTRMRYRQLELSERKEIKRLFKKLCSPASTTRLARLSRGAARNITGYKSYLSWPKDSPAAIKISPSLEEDETIAREGLEAQARRDREQAAGKGKADLADSSHREPTKASPPNTTGTRLGDYEEESEEESEEEPGQEQGPPREGGRDSEREASPQQKRDGHGEEDAKKQEEVTRFDYLGRVNEKEARLERAKRPRGLALAGKRALSNVALRPRHASPHRTALSPGCGSVAPAAQCHDRCGKAAQTKQGLKIVNDRKTGFFGRANLFPKRLVAEDQRRASDEDVRSRSRTRCQGTDASRHSLFKEWRGLGLLPKNHARQQLPVHAPSPRLGIQQSQLLELIGSGLCKITNTSTGPSLNRAHRWWQKRRMCSSLLGSPSKRYVAMPDITRDDWKKIVEWQLETYLFGEEKRVVRLRAKKPRHHFKIKRLFVYLPWVTLKKPVRKVRDLASPSHTPCSAVQQLQSNTTAGQTAGKVLGLHRARPYFVTRAVEARRRRRSTFDPSRHGKVLHGPASPPRATTKQLVFEWPVTRLDYENSRKDGPLDTRLDGSIVKNGSPELAAGKTPCCRRPGGQGINCKPCTGASAVLTGLKGVPSRPGSPVPSWKRSHYLVSPCSQSLYSNSPSYKVGNSHEALAGDAQHRPPVSLFNGRQGDKNSLCQPLLFEPVTAYSCLVVNQLFFVVVLKRFSLYTCRTLLKSFLNTLKLPGLVAASLSALFEGVERPSAITKPYRVKKRLRDVVGSLDNLSASSEIVWYLRNLCRGRSRLRGVILVGAASSELSDLLRAIAGEAQTPVIVESLRALTLTQRHPQRRLEKLLTFAQRKAPSLLFLDDLDAIGRSRPGLLQGTNKGARASSLTELESPRTGLESSSELTHSLLVSRLLAASQALRCKEDRFFVTGRGPACKASFSRWIERAQLAGPSSATAKPTTKFAARSLTGGHANGAMCQHKLGASLRGPSSVEQRKTDLMLRLLTVMDGISRFPGVVLVTTSQNPSLLDPALLRPGRFERRVHVRLPSKKRRVELLQMQTKKIGHTGKIGWDCLSNQAADMSGAEIASAVNHSLFRAIVDNTAHTVHTLEHGIRLARSVPLRASEPKTLSRTLTPSSCNNGILQHPRRRAEVCQRTPRAMSCNIVYNSNVSQIAFYQAGKGVQQGALDCQPELASLTLTGPLREPAAAQELGRHDALAWKGVGHKGLRAPKQPGLSTGLISLFAGQAGEAVYLSSTFSHRLEGRSLVTLRQSSSSCLDSLQASSLALRHHGLNSILSPSQNKTLCRPRVGSVHTPAREQGPVEPSLHDPGNQPDVAHRLLCDRTKLARRCGTVRSTNPWLSRVTARAYSLTKGLSNYGPVRSASLPPRLLRTAACMRDSLKGNALARDREQKKDAWWREETCLSFNSLQQGSGKWYRVYLNRIEQDKNNKEWLAPDQLVNQRMSLPNYQAKGWAGSQRVKARRNADRRDATARHQSYRSSICHSTKRHSVQGLQALHGNDGNKNLPSSGLLNRTDLGLLNSDLLYYNSALPCFYMAFVNCLENRELLDLLADHLIRFKALRRHEIARISSFYLQHERFLQNKLL